MSDLTERQSEILSFLRQRQAEGRPASVREIGQRFGIQSPNGVCCHTRALIAKGFVVKVPGTRGYRVAPDSYDLELERIKAHWRTLPDYARRELLSICEKYHEAVTVHEEVK